MTHLVNQGKVGLSAQSPGPQQQPHACIFTTMQRTIPVCNSDADLECQLTIQPLPNKINPKPLTSDNADGGGNQISGARVLFGVEGPSRISHTSFERPTFCLSKRCVE